MHVNIAKAPTRAVYVPAPSRPAVVDETPPYTRLPRASAVAPIAEVLRVIPWSGEAEAAPSPPAVTRRRDRYPAQLKARQLFAEVRWTGESPGEPTAAQRANTVKQVFESFGWE